MKNNKIFFLILISLVLIKCSNEKDSEIKKEVICDCFFKSGDKVNLLYGHKELNLDSTELTVIRAFKHTSEIIVPDCLYEVGQGVNNVLTNGMVIHKEYRYVQDQFLKNH